MMNLCICCTSLCVRSRNIMRVFDWLAALALRDSPWLEDMAHWFVGFEGEEMMRRDGMDGLLLLICCASVPVCVRWWFGRMIGIVRCVVCGVRCAVHRDGNEEWQDETCGKWVYPQDIEELRYTVRSTMVTLLGEIRLEGYCSLRYISNDAF
ncbi:hypothetical protein ACMFMG_004879 [Clarireedia jacksonii]